MLQSLHKALPSTTLHYKACKSTSNYILLCTTKPAQGTPQYYCVLQSFQKAPSGTTLYCNACTKYSPVPVCTTKLAPKHFPVLLCTARLAQRTPQYYILCTTTILAWSSSQYFVLQILHKVPPRTTLYRNACTKNFPVLGTSRYYFVLQILHKAPPSTALYYKACTNWYWGVLCASIAVQSRT